MSEPAISQAGKSLIVPHGCSNARVFLCTPVDDFTASRSTFLTTLTEYEGIIELPKGFDASDLRAWANLRPNEAENLSASELGHALQVCLARSPNMSYP